MTYTVVVQVNQYIDIDAETAEAAIEAVKTKLDPRVAASAHYSIVKDMEEQQQEEKQPKGE